MPFLPRHSVIVESITPNVTEASEACICLDAVEVFGNVLNEVVFLS